MDDAISNIEAALDFAGSQGWHPFHCDDICALLDRLKAAEEENERLRKALTDERDRLREALQPALDALTESLDLVQHDYDTDWRHALPTRKSQMDAKLLTVNAHRDAIAIVRAALENTK